MKWQSDSKVLIQGLNEPLAAYYGARMKSSGTNIVGGISSDYQTAPMDGIPVFNLVEEAVKQVGQIDISLIFSPPYQVLDAALEAIAAGIGQIVIISSGVPPLDMVKLLRLAQGTNTFILGSGSQGLLVPEQFFLGMMESSFYVPGPVGIISRCDRLIDEVARELTQAKFGQSLAISLGSDGIIGSNFEQWLQIMEEDDNTQVIILLGQPHSSAEISAAEYIVSAIEKPVITYISGIYAPVERNFGDATTIIANQLFHRVPTKQTEQKTISAFKKAGIKLAQSPSEIVKLVKGVLSPKKSK
ncbi:succinate--CoA ligase subunit alpha [Aphanothece sacrum]|uniref:CoA-binding protein n=1 Tax=Aphanothece sacrum FPU1 TaxID=1920663 RepID=A0A401IDW2_APHSA|nr:CoA-binding protein [Aphanothece sacrum]GBF79455.1 CoA-binding protein [Aphanothece sacrum FPU1]GBF85995.1 CoA-binding protein [Aphanothece sacrum FPU3]